jgi:brefeldin A-inhibited guanine nucleotide-exchange protein
VELLCRCDDIADDGVELRVLKGLLTAVTSNTLHVHGQALLLVSGWSQDLMGLLASYFR